MISSIYALADLGQIIKYLDLYRTKFNGPTVSSFNFSPKVGLANDMLTDPAG